MKAIIDKSGCVSCGLCISACPEVFRFDGAGLAEAYEDIKPETADRAEEARDGCPVQVISIVD
jgi:ferredoxin